jgi:hypothetical protein
VGGERDLEGVDALLAASDWVGALRALGPVRRERPKDPEVWKRQAFALRGDGHVSEAKVAALLWIDLEPGSVEAQAFLDSLKELRDRAENDRSGEQRRAAEMRRAALPPSVLDQEAIRSGAMDPPDLPSSRSRRRASWFERHRTALRVAVVAVVVVIGAVLVVRARGNTSLADAGAHPAGGATPSSAVPGSTAASAPADTAPVFEARSYQAGECATWPEGQQEPNLLSVDIVPCDAPHLTEMAGDVPMSVVPDHYPTGDEWPGIIHRDCAKVAEALLGAPVDPHGRFLVGALFPSPDSWGHGDRTLRCDIGVAKTAPAAPGVHPSFTGEVKGQPQELLLPIGTCIDTSPAIVPCAAPHQSEVTGNVDLSDRTTTVPKDLAAWNALIGADCLTLATGYLGHPPTPSEGPMWYPIDPTSWALGARTVQCGVAGLSGTTQVTITAPLRPH